MRTISSSIIVLICIFLMSCKTNNAFGRSSENTIVEFYILTKTGIGGLTVEEIKKNASQKYSINCSKECKFIDRLEFLFQGARPSPCKFFDERGDRLELTDFALVLVNGKVAYRYRNVGVHVQKGSICREDRTGATRDFLLSGQFLAVE